MMKLLLYDFLSILYPSLCPGCGSPMGYGESIICTICRSKWPTLRSAGWVNDNMIHQLEARVGTESGYSFLRYEKESIVQNILRSIKYKNNPELAEELGAIFGKELKMNWLEYDLLVPVPLHFKKRKIRGYNQSERLALGISRVTELPIDSDNLYRTKNTDTQTSKSRVDRLINVENVFAIRKPDAFKNKRVLLVDDVFTTGATIEACASIILISGAQRVTPVTLATGQ